ncbi:MAG: DUF554 family protein, partial [Clostridiales bacterium]|nr:DUF554 family protein [Clostridiales bacterium]
MTGVLVNAAAILCGSLIGLLLGKIKSEKLGGAVMTGLALCLMYIGISGAVESGNEITGNIKPYYVLIVIFSIVIGTVIGTLLKIDERLEALGEKIENKLGHGESFAKSFV